MIKLYHKKEPVSKIILIFCLVFLMCWFNSAFAAGELNGQPSGVLDNVTNTYLAQMKVWDNAIKSAAKTIFYSLMLISLSWRFMMMGLKGGQLNDIIIDLVRTIMIAGLFAWAVNNSDEVLKGLFQSFGNFARSSSGLGEWPTATGLMTNGTEAAVKVFKGIGWGDALDGAIFLKILVGGAIIVLFAFIAINVLLAFVAFYFLLYAGIILLALWGSDWTKDTAIMYLKALLARSIEYYGMIMLCALTLDVFNDCVAQYKAASGDDAWLPLATLLAATIVTYLCIGKLPHMLASCVAPIQSAGVSASGFAAAAGLTAAAGMMMGAAKTFAKSVAGGAKNAAMNTASGLGKLASAAAGTPAAKAFGTAAMSSIPGAAAAVSGAKTAGSFAAKTGGMAAEFFGGSQSNAARHHMARDFMNKKGADGKSMYSSAQSKSMAADAQSMMRNNKDLSRSEAMELAELKMKDGKSDPSVRQNSVSGGGAGGDHSSSGGDSASSGSTGSAFGAGGSGGNNDPAMQNYQRNQYDVNGPGEGNGQVNNFFVR